MKRIEIAVYITCVTKIKFYCNCFTALDEPIYAARAYTPNQAIPKQSVKLWCKQTSFKYKKLQNNKFNSYIHCALCI